MASSSLDWIGPELERLAAASLERVIGTTAPASPGHVERRGRTLLDLSSNDYLGLARHPAIIEAMREALLAEGAGSGASRLATGSRPPYERLEQALAQWHGKGGALVLASGYMANAGVIPALVGRQDVVFSDRLNHASIVDGIALSRAEHARYRHGDMDHLRVLLQKHRGKRRKLIVTDAVFSMDGDQAPLAELVELKREHGAMLMADEAHSGGIYGRRGEGLAAQLGLQDEIDVHLGTFGKAFGLYGAYLCGSRELIRWLSSAARPLVYSTALPPSVPAGVMAALELIQAGPERRMRLLAASRMFRASLTAAGLDVPDGDSPIVPLRIGESDQALRVQAALEEEGIAALAVRPPTVPAGTARIRFSLSAAHSDAELAAAASRIVSVCRRLGLGAP
ncbi:8-amino-7-oxononanoate synthase [Paenibacillus albicereus]|uniref:8-amino-7-ketopelargonate synthase n=1 Tax=Paenibacillus albicereus TaxID=2726185 RepID=A0A6H2H074_9BACL|nr:8-amino-7-oxononanoate synthase [Paenibacillus albicereus]QJC53091.1 8-amino-7-oxononanoate synthase [Paenibacillus albicereus]